MSDQTVQPFPSRAALIKQAAGTLERDGVSGDVAKKVKPLAATVLGQLSTVTNTEVQRFVESWMLTRLHDPDAAPAEPLTIKFAIDVSKLANNRRTDLLAAVATEVRRELTELGYDNFTVAMKNIFLHVDLSVDMSEAVAAQGEGAHAAH